MSSEPAIIEVNERAPLLGNVPQKTLQSNFDEFKVTFPSNLATGHPSTFLFDHIFVSLRMDHHDPTIHDHP
jgi:alpha-N-acetylglucosamine transferase